MARLKQMEQIVRPILEQHENTRGDDKMLYYWVLKSLGFDTSVPLSWFLFSSDFPNWESITRVRRRLQEENPELLPKENVKKGRRKAEKEFLDYVRE